MGTQIPCILFVHITRKEHLKKAFYLKRNNGTHCTTFPFNNFFFRARGRHTQKMGHHFSAGKISFSSRGYSFSPKKGEKWRGQSWIFDRRIKENPWSHNLWQSRNLLQFLRKSFRKLSQRRDVFFGRACANFQFFWAGRYFPLSPSGGNYPWKMRA